MQINNNLFLNPKTKSVGGMHMILFFFLFYFRFLINEYIRHMLKFLLEERLENKQSQPEIGEELYLFLIVINSDQQFFITLIIILNQLILDFKENASFIINFLLYFLKINLQ